MRICLSILLVSTVAPWLTTANGDEREKTDFFEKRIRPVLIQSCYQCHSSQTDEPEGGLRLDSREFIRKGGDSGPAVIPGSAEKSLLIKALRYDDLEMPPKNQLPDEVIEQFSTWINLGAVDPRDKPDAATTHESWSAILASRRDWWSLQPVQDPAIPETHSDWPRRPLDHFIYAKLKDAELQPAQSASTRHLIRRLSIVLTGLPPTPDETESFVRDCDIHPDLAYESLVDRLIDSPHFGERWARHWMDVVRYTETHGNEWNYEVHHAWRYRDYLIRAFNSDVPYDQFVREHIAGDLLESPRWNTGERIHESLIGTSFYRFGEVNHDDCVTLTSIGYDILDNQIDTLSKAFQATTIACARCHHHKIDAVSMQDYYALLGILKSSRLTAHTIDADSVNAEPVRRLRQLKSEIKAEVIRIWRSQTDTIERYLLAADAKIRESKEAADLSKGMRKTPMEKWLAALQVESSDIAHPIWAWKNISAASDIASKWKQLTETFQKSQQENATFNAEHFVSSPGWQSTDGNGWWASGQGLRESKSASGDFTVTNAGEVAIAAVLPKGRFTHLLSQKLNGTLRSPVLPAGKKKISALVLGDKTSAFRLVSNNCQLNYANYRALTSAKPTWITFTIPENAPSLNTFAELVTKFDNPKFPDQLGTLGGDRSNDRIPWEQAAADPRSYFGIMRVVLHDIDSTPKSDLAPLARLLSPDVKITSRAELARHYAQVIRSAIDAWADGKTTDADVYWLSWVVENNLLDHSLAARPQLSDCVHKYRTIEADEMQLPRLAAGMADFGNGLDHPLLERGNYEAPRERVPRRYLEILADKDQPFNASGSGRLQLAHAIASADNPLTARVMVNRVWHHLFGAGLVKTVDDFGRIGELPSHPELLDHLSTRFMKSDAQGGMGWSIKRLIREIVLSQSFRMSGRSNDRAKKLDPLNRWLHHYPSRRMEAEAIRDSILAVSGRLQRDFYGMSVQPYREKPNDFRRLFGGPLDGDGRRSVYVKINLMEGPKFLDTFNLPGGKIAQGRRDRTNVPAQALTLLNDKFVLQQAEYWADRLLQIEVPTSKERISRMFLEALSRHPTSNEMERFHALAQSLADLHGRSDMDILAQKIIWRDVAHVMLNLKEFIYIP